MPDNYKALKELEERAFTLMCTAHNIDLAEVSLFNAAHAQAKKDYPTIFREDEEPGENPRAPHHAAYRTMIRLRGFLSLELGVNLEEYEKALKEQ